jgi:hypothetical protein
MGTELRIVSIDPGVTTGYTFGLLVPNERLDVYPHQLTHDVDDFWRHIKAFEPQHIVIERFEFRQGKQHAGINLFPRELIGVARLYSLVAPPPVAIDLQTAAQGKSYFSDKTLKANGLYARGVPHAMDSLRHMMQWLTFGAGYQFRGSSKEKFTHYTPVWPPLHKIIKQK